MFLSIVINNWSWFLRPQTLHLLVPHCPAHCSSDAVLTALTRSASGAVLVSRHGAILALGNVLLALTQVATTQSLPYNNYISESIT